MASGRRYTRAVAALIGVLVLVRLGAAALGPLAFDEAYYWLWSKHLAAGYFDHPPMVAIVIRLGTLLAGDTELGVRLVAVLLGVPATWAVWRAAAILFSDAILAADAALFFNVTLIVAAGTVVVTPDTPLLVASAFVLYCLAKLNETQQGYWWVATGAAIGAALLSKYSAFFFGIGILLWVLIVPAQRRWLLTPWPYLGGATALAIFAPVIGWNATHGFASFAKQFGRTAVSGFHPHYLGEHLLAQIGLATPSIFLLGWMGVSAFVARERRASAAMLIVALIAPLTLYFLWHSLHTRVEGNWTAPLFPAFSVAAAAAAHRVPWRGWAGRVSVWSRKLAAPVGIVLALLIYAQAVWGIVPLGAADPTARQLGAGWPELGERVDALRREAQADAVLTSSYAATAWLAFYLPSRPPVIQVNERIRWVDVPPPDPALWAKPVLYVCKTSCDDALLRATAEGVTLLGEFARTRRGVAIESYAIYRAQLRADPLEKSPSR